MDQVNRPDEIILPKKVDVNLVEVPLTPEDQVQIQIENVSNKKIATAVKTIETETIDKSIINETTLVNELSNQNDSANIIQSTESIEQTPEKKKLTAKQKKIASFILAGLILSGIVAGTIFENSKNKGQPTDNPMPTITEPSKIPTQSTTSPETSPTSPAKEILTVKSLEVDASLISDPELLSKTFVDKLLTEWWNAGATPDNANAAYDFGSLPIYAKKIAAEYDKIFIEAILIEDWESNPRLVDFVNRTTTIHYQVLTAYFATSSLGGYLDPDDKVPYLRGSKCTKVDSFTSPKNGSITIQTTENDYDNADENRIGEGLSDGTKVNSNSIAHPTTIYDTVDGKLKISDIIFN